MKTDKFAIFLFYALVACNIISCGTKDESAENRKKMVEEQIIERGISNQKVIDAMLKVERHKFVPDSLSEKAYWDTPLPIEEGQTISQPYIVAFMTETLELDENHKVLEIGTGSGYQAAILAEICKEVYSIEISSLLYKNSTQLLINELKYQNIKIRNADGYLGWEEFAPYDRIIVTCSPTHVPEPLKEQLSEGGRIIIPVGSSWQQELVLLTKINGEIIQENIVPVRFVPMLKVDGENY
jgi:protein-L-isoaspartate(D-aspartate) O-methyltransferase